MHKKMCENVDQQRVTNSNLKTQEATKKALKLKRAQQKKAETSTIFNFFLNEKYF